jgi:hypothetical protein
LDFSFSIQNPKSKIGLPVHGAFLAGIDLRQFDAFVKEKNFQVVEQKIVRVGIRNVQAEMIDELILFLQPFLPAGLANLVIHTLSDFIGKRRELHLLVLAPAARAFEFITRK